MNTSSTASEAEFDPLVDEAPSRYVVGIDLGTTNSAVSYIDTSKSDRTIHVFPIKQLVGFGETEDRQTLPSFHYQPVAAQVAGKVLALPWHKKPPRQCVGVLAREESAKTAGRGIASAKSWLCHPGVDRTAQLLPWHCADDVERLSPVEASSRYLRHIRDAWNHVFTNEPLERQDIVLTLPASFDEVARELTVQAAANAKLNRVVLIEEPQAAFYAWVHKHEKNWDSLVEVGQKILVCDIGGGTSDFTLIHVEASEGEKVQFHRVAVGNHLILGGDNLDLALAKHLESKLTGGGQLQAKQWDTLVGSSRQLKETLLGDEAPDELSVSVPSSGSKLIGGSLQTTIRRDDVQRLLIDGFLPDVGLTDAPNTAASGFQELGLPYASDPAITRHLAAFLWAHRDPDSDEPTAARPDIVLFNGGFFASAVLRTKTLDAFDKWFGQTPHVLENDRLDLAVARGAAYYGMVRRGEGVKIAASLARTYYIGVESDEPAVVCLVPGNAEAGQVIDLERTFKLTISQPVEFSLYVSSTRLADVVGDVLPVDLEQMTALPPIRTVLRVRSRNEKRDVTIRLHVRLTEIGTLDLSCHEVDGERQWKLQFDVRSTTQTDVETFTPSGEAEGFIDETTWNACQTSIQEVFGENGTAKPAELVRQLAAHLDAERTEWPMSVLRRIWETLMEFENGRRKSVAHEARWLNLLGYALRPGYGVAVDDWRVTETWRRVQGKLVHPAPNIRAEALILWRRLAGGLSRGQQVAVADPLISSLRGLQRLLRGKKAKAGTTVAARPEETMEVWRLLGSLEHLSVAYKVDLGEMIVDMVAKPSLAKARDAMIWALGRLGQRTPLYGPLNGVVPVERVRKWADIILAQYESNSVDHLSIVQMTRRTDDRYRDVDETFREQVIDWLTNQQASQHLVELVATAGHFDSKEQGRVFGEALPKGLKLE